MADVDVAKRVVLQEIAGLKELEKVLDKKFSDLVEKNLPDNAFAGWPRRHFRHGEIGAYCAEDCGDFGIYWDAGIFRASGGGEPW